jgi:predicted MFS family arabinose efflux permease
MFRFEKNSERWNALARHSGAETARGGVEVRLKTLRCALRLPMSGSQEMSEHPLDRLNRTPDATARGMRRILFAVTPLVILSQFFRSSNAVIAPSLISDLALSADDIANVSGSFFLIFAVMQIPLGVLLDRFGARLIMSSLMVLAVVGSLCFAASETRLDLVLGQLLIGTGCAGLMVGSLVILARWYPQGRFAGAMATLFAFANAGNLAATLPLAAAVTAWGWRSTFVGLAVITALLAGIFFLVVRDAPPDHPYHDRRPETLLQVARGLGKIIRTRDLCLVFPMVAVGYASFISIVGLWGGPYLDEVYGLDPIARGKVLSVMALSMIAGTLAYGWLDHRFASRRALTTIGGCTTGLILLVLALESGGPLWSTVALLCLFGCFGAYSLVVMAHGLALFPDELVGRGTTALNTALMGGAAIIQAVTGAVVDAFPHRHGSTATMPYALVFAMLAGLTLVTLLVYRRARDVDGSASRPVAQPGSAASDSGPNVPGELP